MRHCNPHTTPHTLTRDIVTLVVITFRAILIVNRGETVLNMISQ